jgi:hypothetical protein
MELTFGTLVLDETELQSAFSPKRIYKTHKQKESIPGGYVNGQTIVFLLLVTNAMGMKVGFAFYMPDPVCRSWKKIF